MKSFDVLHYHVTEIRTVSPGSVSYGDSDFGVQALTFGEKHEFADFLLLPSQHKVVYRIDDRVPLNTSGLFDFFPFRPQLSSALALVRSLGYPVIGRQNRMMSSGARLDSHQDVLITACPWDPRIKGEFFHQTTLSVPLRHVKEFINNIKELVKIEPKFLCILEDSNGILMRYVTSSPAFLGKEEKALHFDLTYYRSKDDPLVPRLYEDFIEEIELMAVFKYNALPHWGKNRNIAFNDVIKKYKNAIAFLKVKERFDPLGLFSREWTDQILGLKGSVTIVKEGCELEGLCIFSEDSQFLTVLRGYMCRPGKVYREARVCTRV
ncbi:hypothetical protein HID58_088013 [Brassica napus]|uniref:L-gulonolactone oxidase n=2 Tax=Brassica napus TaxID=3708 RepID=A0ABQ7XWS8_BRANA|nr:hypothetical protein HID58_088013 [Brassica napus]